MGLVGVSAPGEPKRVSRLAKAIWFTVARERADGPTPAGGAYSVAVYVIFETFD